MMSARTRFALAVVVLGLLRTGPFILTALIVWAETEGESRQVLVNVLAPHLGLGTMLTALGFAAGIGVVRTLFRQYVQGLLRMSENLRLMLGANRGFRVQPEGPPEVQSLALAMNQLASQRDELMCDVAAQIGRAKESVELEKNRLAALMSELTQSVVVCNLDGRVLLYNNRARTQFRALSDAPGVAGGGELIGLGRSIYGVFERNLIAHALDTVQLRLRRGVPQPQANFVTTTRAGQLLRVQMAPVLSVVSAREQAAVEQAAVGEGEAAGEAGAAEPERTVTGFILMLDNITRSFDEQTARDRLLYGLIEKSRASLASTQAAVEMLGYDDLEPAMRERFLGVLREEAATMGARIDEVARRSARNLHTRWPLEDIRGLEFVDVAARQIEAQCRLPVGIEAVDPALWLRLDSFSMLQALSYLGERLVDEFQVRALQLRLAAQGARAQLDLIWTGQAMSTETVMSWELDPMRIGGENSPLSVREVLDRHDAEMWFERDRVRHQAFFRFLLPLAAAGDEAAADLLQAADSRPEFFDFDLFGAGDASGALDDRPLAELTYTVFDTETTGLNPSDGDEIIQIGAARVVNGRLLRQESFEQLVDPGRDIPAAGIPIHGITPEMVAGQPRIEAVLPTFHQYVQDTVLVAHNAAFDMKFLQLLEQRTGLAFQQPVLDTLLLSAVVHPNQESHRLEAIAERFGVTVLGRHTALGDALVTAEVLIKLIPLLKDMGILTLGQARAAAQKTYYARLKY